MAALTRKLKIDIATYVKQVVQEKLEQWTPETTYSPFLESLLGSKGRVAFYSFVHSLVTTFGMSLYEEIACGIACARGLKAQKKYQNVGTVPEEVDSLIMRIVTQLAEGTRVANKVTEIEEIRNAIKPYGQLPARSGRDKIVDLWIRKEDGKEYLFDIKTVKPNLESFVDFKRKLLRWVALRLSQSSDVDVVTALAFPYNPYYPEPYDRFTMKGMFDTEQELFVADKFWDFLGGRGTYMDLVGVFDEVGKSLKEDIDQFLARLDSS